MLACEDDALLRAAPLANWEAAFAQFARMAGAGPLLVVLDEYQYAAESDPTLASHLQRWWSREAVHLPLYLVLCGSYVRFFVHNVLTGPAYGRNTGALQLRPLGYRQAAALLPTWSVEDLVRAYAVVGGVPHYLTQLDPNRGLAWNIQRHLLRRGAVLYEEAELLTREELREPRLYYSILRAISEGCTRVSDIAARIRPPSSRSDITPYLHTLAELGLTEYRQPIVGGGLRRGVWVVADPYLRFWFRFVLPNRRQLEHGVDIEQLYQQIVVPQLDHFVSRPTFEDLCRTWVLEQAQTGAFGPVDDVGAWWGPIPQPTPEQPRRQAEAELEVIAVHGKRVVLAGEAKWSREPIGPAVLRRLRDVVRHVPGADEHTQLALFGQQFDPRLRDVASAEGVLLIGPKELYHRPG